MQTKGTHNKGYKKRFGKFVCLYCNKGFERARSRVRKYPFCSHKCYSMWNMKTHTCVPPTKGNYITCPRCGKTRYRSQANLHHKYCNSECANKSRIGKFAGENCIHWKGGKSFEPYPLEWTRHFKNGIRERDEYTCQICGKKEMWRKHSAHHMDEDKKNISPENLMLLCCKCHMKIHAAKMLYVCYAIRFLGKLY